MSRILPKSYLWRRAVIEMSRIGATTEWARGEEVRNMN
jgi:hypothetical protein